MRLDKWLWAARFYKTRGLAAEAVDGGRVHLNGQRTKPGKPVRIGLVGLGEMGTDIFTGISRMDGIRIGAVHERTPGRAAEDEQSPSRLDRRPAPRRRRQ
mgnify:CR=1 FL=1